MTTLHLAPSDVDARIDCPADLAMWSVVQVHKACRCLSYLEQGMHDAYRQSVRFAELSDDLEGLLADPTYLAGHPLFFRWTPKEIAHAQACLAYVRHGLPPLVAQNIRYSRLAHYLREMAAHDPTEEAEQLEA